MYCVCGDSCPAPPRLASPQGVGEALATLAGQHLSGASLASRVPVELPQHEQKRTGRGSSGEGPQDGG